MAALKITVERVDPGAVSPGKYDPLDVTDRLPLVVIIPDIVTAGITVAQLKKLIAVAHSGDLGTAVASVLATDSLETVIDEAWTEHVLA